VLLKKLKCAPRCWRLWKMIDFRCESAILAAMKLSESTWSPFQSPEVREICAHLTPDEKARLIANAGQCGTETGEWISAWMSAKSVPIMAGFLLLFFAFQIFSWRGFWVGWALLLILLTIYFVVASLPRRRAMRRRSMELLCATEWAREHGYTPERLRLMKFPFVA
jgi:hypothetical protein